MEKQSRPSRVTGQIGASLLRLLLGGFGFLFVGTALTGAFYGVYKFFGGDLSCGDAFKTFGPPIAQSLSHFILASHLE